MEEPRAHPDIRIGKDGVWYFQGAEMIRTDIVRYLYQYLKMDNTGQYYIEIENDRCYVAVDDAPFVIKSVDTGLSQDDGHPFILASLSDGSSEELSLDMPFWHGADNALYCMVKGRRYPARFSRPAYYQFCGHIEHNPASGTYMISVNKRSFPLVFIDQP